MQRVLTVVLALACGTALGWDCDEIDKVDVAPLNVSFAQWRPAPVRKPHKVLLFTECFGYNHHGGRCYGEYCFKQTGERSGAWSIVQTKDAKRLADAAFLADFDAIVFCNSSGLMAEMAPGMTKALTDFVNDGKGIALIHAGLDAFKDSDELLALFGGYFKGHPWHQDGTWSFRNEQPADPINASFLTKGVIFEKMDEIYEFPAFFDRRHCKVLISMNLDDPMTSAAEAWWGDRFGPGTIRADHDYAVSWTRTVGKGRIFYTSFGHDRGAFLDRERLYHMFAGLQWVLKDLEPEAKIAYDPLKPVKRTDWAGGPALEKLNERAKSLKGKELDIVIFGASCIMGWTFPADYRFPGGKEVWERHFGGLATANFGFSGDRTDNLLWRIVNERQADGWTAKNVIITCGLNNALAAEDPVLSAKGFKAVVDAIAERHPESKIILLGLTPMQRKLDWIRTYNALMSELADGKRVFYHDPLPAFMEDEKTVSKTLFRDGVHPGPVGYEVFAQEIEKALNLAK